MVILMKSDMCSAKRWHTTCSQSLTKCSCNHDIHLSKPDNTNIMTAHYITSPYLQVNGTIIQNPALKCLIKINLGKRVSLNTHDNWIRKIKIQMTNVSYQTYQMVILSK